MKISNYTTLLLVFIFLALPCKSQQNKDKGYKGFYKSVNKYNALEPVRANVIQDPDVIIDTITVGQLDSVMNNMVGVTDIMQGGKSILHPVVTLELDPQSSASEALFGSVETLDRDPDIGKGMLDPKIKGIKFIKRTSAVPETAEETPAEPTEVSEHTTIIAMGTAPASRRPSIPVPNAPSITSSPAKTPFRELNEADWKLFRSMNVKLVDQTEQPYLKKYAIVLGSFRNLNNANYIKRTFNSLGEHSIVVKTDTNLYLALLGSFQTEAEAIQKLEEVYKYYVEGVSKTRRVSRFGVPLDDLWILNINK
ncbi:SPOR domain-containing protein [Prevotella sp. 10(H)]|uniref:SPOR domain-containing protein n=1 Tax=Prevotella sp. 10(H) TaxID=1158294 RepID=UPI0004A6AD04|nr:SPOR domain-containing protein [Prevotella sp. 10(H)]